MNRRDALKTMAAGLAAFVLPGWRKQIDLRAFCSRWPLAHFDCNLPYCLEDWTYATDKRICVRVRPALTDVVQHTGKVPPFEGLSWNHDLIRGWRELPRLEPIVADHTACPSCDGLGHTGTEPGHDCERCDGMGKEWVGSEWDISHPITCRACQGRGYSLPPGAAVCPACGGNAIGRFPGLVNLGGKHYDVKLYERARGLGAEYVQDVHPSKRLPKAPLLKFRFDGGTGLLMGLDAACVTERLGGRT